MGNDGRYLVVSKTRGGVERARAAAWKAEKAVIDRIRTKTALSGTLELEIGGAEALIPGRSSRRRNMPRELVGTQLAAFAWWVRHPLLDIPLSAMGVAVIGGQLGATSVPPAALTIATLTVSLIAGAFWIVSLALTARISGRAVPAFSRGLPDATMRSLRRISRLGLATTALVFLVSPLASLAGPGQAWALLGTAIGVSISSVSRSLVVAISIARVTAGVRLELGTGARDTGSHECTHEVGAETVVTRSPEGGEGGEAQAYCSGSSLTSRGVAR